MNRQLLSARNAVNVFEVLGFPWSKSMGGGFSMVNSVYFVLVRGAENLA